MNNSGRGKTKKWQRPKDWVLLEVHVPPWIRDELNVLTAKTGDVNRRNQIITEIFTRALKKEEPKGEQRLTEAALAGMLKGVLNEVKCQQPKVEINRVDL